MSQYPEVRRLRPKAGQRPEQSFLTKILQLLFIAICTLTFVFPMLTACGILLGKNAVGGRDYVEYWAAGQQLVHHRDPYDAGVLQPLERSVGLPVGVDAIVTPNPPTALPLMLPLGLVSAMVGSRLWTLALLASLILSVRMTRAMHGSPKNEWHWLGYSFAPAVVSLARGQVSILILLGLVLFLRFYRTRPYLAGASLWLCAVKPHLFLPFGVALFAWAIAGRRYRVLLGAAGAMALSAGIVTAFNPAVWGEWVRSMRVDRIDRIPIPCLSNMLRRAISPDTMWLQYVPAALACVWALVYFRRHKDDWDWWGHGSVVVLVSLLVAPYTWLTDQVILIPALLHGVYVSRSRGLIAMLGLASAVIQMSPLLGGPELTHSVWYAWTAPAWLVGYLVATRSSRVSPAAVGSVA